MALPEQYLITTKNLSTFFNSLLNAQPPAKLTNRFLEQLEFKSTNDRLFIGVLKALKFIDVNGVPQELYYKFIDQTQSKTVLAEAIKEAYSDLFAINLKANEMSPSEVKNKLKTLLQGTKTDHVLSLMANTFHALCNYADFKKETRSKDLVTINTDVVDSEEIKDEKQEQTRHELIKKTITTEMHYNIQIHLPETRDVVVYDAIFKSLKEHLL